MIRILVRQTLVKRWIAWISLAATAAGLAGFQTPAAAAAEPNGARLYRRYCASCHGATGRGDGPDASIFATPPRNLREGFLKKYKTDDLVRRLLDGRSLELALDLPALRTRATEVEDLVTYLKRLPTIHWSQVGPGWEIYVDRCEICHGPTGLAPPTLPVGVHRPNDLSDPAFQRSVTDKELMTIVRHGRKGMPALTPRVPKSGGKPLAAFVRLFSPGFTLYSRYCANCHGDDGRGESHLSDAIRMPSVTFDRAYFKRRDPEQLRRSVWHMLDEQKPVMPHYRWAVSEAQARAIIEYLKSSEP
jgi:mono/diheme cytochrome c family protein